MSPRRASHEEDGAARTQVTVAARNGGSLLAAFLMLSASAFAQCTLPNCSAVIPTTTATAAISSSSYGLKPMRTEVRIHGANWNSASNVLHIFSTGGFAADYLGGGTNEIFFAGPDSGESGGFVNMGASPPSDIIIRIDRDVAAMQMRCEIFATETGLQLGTTLTYTITALASGATIQAAGITLGASGATGNIAFMRWYDSSVPAGIPPIVGLATPSLLGDWEFDNNRNDRSGLRGQNLGGPALAYVNTPSYVPNCNAGPQQTVTVGATLNLDGTSSRPLDGNSTLNYTWSYFPGSDGINQNPDVNAGNSATPNVTGLNQFGSANFQLTVTDSSLQTATCSVHDGVVFANPKGVVNLIAEGVDRTSQKIIGPLIQWGKNPWPWADDRQKYTLDVQIANMQNGAIYSPWWRTLAAGTVTITAGSANVVGTGTAFQTGGANAICSGTAPRDPDTVLIIQYMGTDSLTHYTPVSIVSCSSDTAAVLNWRGVGAGGSYPMASALPPYPFPNCDSGCSGLAISVGGGFNNWGGWLFTPAPANFYDVVKSLRSMYLRSGIDTYERSFENYADAFWEWPDMDQGASCMSNYIGWPAVNDWCQPDRNQDLAGVVLRALQQGSGSPKWSGLRIIWARNEYLLGVFTPIYIGNGLDDRETGYQVAGLAYCALADPDSTQVANCKSTIKNSLTTTFTPALAARSTDTLTWSNLFVGQSSVTALGGSGSVCVTNGSPLVVGTGTNWNTGLSTGQPGGGNFWTWRKPAGVMPANTGGDSLSYAQTVLDATDLLLAIPYQGPTECNRGWAFATPSGNSDAGWLGWSVQPYAVGMLGTAFGFAAQAMDDYDAPSAALFRTYMDNTVQWIINYGLNPDLGGFYYVSMSVGCVPPISASLQPGAACYPSNNNQTQERTLSLDAMRDFAMDYSDPASPGYLSARVKATGDLLMNQMFAKPGTCTGAPCTPDGFYLSDFDNGGGFVAGPPPSGSAQKWTGQLCGYQEACDMWPAVRLGPPLATNGTDSAGAVLDRGKGNFK